MMNKGSYRYLAALGLGLLLGEARAEYWTVDELVKDFSQISAQISRGELQAAESGLNTLRQHTASNDVRIGQYQRELANAYLKQGRQQLQAGNAAAANATLIQGQQHLSAASPALKQEYQASLAASSAESGAKPAAVAAAKPQAQPQPAPTPAPAKVAAKPAVAAVAENPADRREDVERRLQEAEAIIAKKEAERARQQKLAEEQAAAEREASAQQAAATQPAAAPVPAVAKVEAAEPAVAAAPRARLIDPAAASSSVPMPMLDANDRDSLRNLLDQVAADVVAFDCAVRLEVREAKDYPFVAALLSARIKKLDPAFAPQFSPVLKPDQEPRLVLSPQGNG